MEEAHMAHHRPPEYVTIGDTPPTHDLQEIEVNPQSWEAVFAVIAGLRRPHRRGIRKVDVRRLIDLATLRQKRRLPEFRAIEPERNYFDLLNYPRAHPDAAVFYMVVHDGPDTKAEQNQQALRAVTVVFGPAGTDIAEMRDALVAGAN